MGEPIDTLLAQAIGGDVDALSSLLREYGPRVRQTLKVNKPWQSALDVDDVMQVTYVEVFLRIKQFVPQGEHSFLAWIRRIARNNLRDAIKWLDRDKRRPPRARVETPGGDDSYVALYELLGATSTTPSRAAAKREAKTALGAALEKLPPDYAKAVRLYDLEGLSGSEAAEAMGRSRGALFMLRTRALDRLRLDLGSGSRFFSHGT